MKNNMIRRLLYIVVMVCITVGTVNITINLSPRYAMADVGNFNSYDSDGGSFDGGGYDGGYGSSNGDSSDFLIWIILLFFTNGPLGFVGLIVVVIVLVFIGKSVSRNSSSSDKNLRPLDSSQIPQNHPNNTEAISAQIKEEDQLFSSDKFISWSKEVFVQLQTAWTKRDWKLARPFENDTLFKTHQLQLQEHIDNKRTNIVENICVNDAYLTAYSKDEDYAYLTVYLNAKMNDYFIDDETGKVLRGDPNKVYRMAYLLKFIRSADTKTNPSTSNLSTTNCPNCGAPTDITSSGQCQYCDSVITTGKFDWVLCEINSVRGY